MQWAKALGKLLEVNLHSCIACRKCQFNVAMTAATDRLLWASALVKHDMASDTCTSCTMQQMAIGYEAKWQQRAWQLSRLLFSGDAPQRCNMEVVYDCSITQKTHIRQCSCGTRQYRTFQLWSACSTGVVPKHERNLNIVLFCVTVHTSTERGTDQLKRLKDWDWLQRFCCANVQQYQLPILWDVSNTSLQASCIVEIV